MGNTCFKAIRELSGSAKHRFQKNPDNIKYLDRWEKTFGFEGDLNIGKPPNPRAGNQEAGATMYVYRPWTAEDEKSN